MVGSAKKCHGVVMSGGQCNFRYAKSKIVCFVLTVNGEINVFLPPGHSLKLCLATCKASQPATTLLSQLKEIFFSWLSGVSYGTLGWLVVLAVPSLGLFPGFGVGPRLLTSPSLEHL